MGATRMTADCLALDCEAEADRIAARWKDIVGHDLRRKGVVVAISGGIDSAACAALAARAFGPSRVFGLMLPERESSPQSLARGRAIAERFGIPHAVEDISPALEGLGCYRRRDEAIRAVFPEYGEGWTNKIVIAGGQSGGFNYFRLVVRTPQGEERQTRLPATPYLQIVASTNFKQRVRKTLEYYHADRLHYAVTGTPNRLEYDQGFFVKLGDGAADAKPIAHLYKSQVYALARHLGVPEETCNASPTTDTYSLAQGQDEFYFALPYRQMDLALWAYNHGVPAAELAPLAGISAEQAAHVYRDIEAKRRTTRYLHAAPRLAVDVSEIGH